MIAAAPEADTLSEDFEALFQAHSQLVFRTAYSITGNRQDAEDVLQSVFARVLQQQGTPSRRSGSQGLAAEIRQQPARYLHRAAVNTSLNVIRSRKRRKLVDGIDVHQIPASTGDVHERDEHHDRLTAALATLTPRALEILTLRYQRPPGASRRSARRAPRFGPGSRRPPSACAIPTTCRRFRRARGAVGRTAST